MEKRHLKFEKVVFFPNVWWDHTWERQHEIICRLTEYLSVKSVAISPMGLVEYKVFDRKLWLKILASIKAVFFRPANVSASQSSLKLSNLTNLSIQRVLPANLSMQYGATKRLHARYLRKKYEIKSPYLVWCTYLNPVVYEIFKSADFKVIDLAERRNGNTEISEKIKLLEAKAVSEADLVVVDNLATFEDYKYVAKKIVYIPQGFNRSEFPRILKNSTYDGAVAYIGNLHKHIDFVWLSRLIEINQRRRFIFIGPILDGRAHQLKQYKNVDFRPAVAKNQLWKELVGCSFGLIPYELSEFTKGVCPTKLFEYLSCGLSVISTPIPEVVQYQANSFIKIMTEPEQLSWTPRIDHLDDFLDDQTWDARCRRYFSEIDQLF